MRMTVELPSLWQKTCDRTSVSNRATAIIARSESLNGTIRDIDRNRIRREKSKTRQEPT